MSNVVLQTDIPELGPVKRGKVRDIYDLGDKLLIVATDRISAFDVVNESGIPGKGKVLTALSLFWFDYLGDITANHLITADVKEMGPAAAAHADALEGRSMLVRKAKVHPIECVVRGYLAGSGWKEYQQSQTVCGVALPAGLVEASQLPEPIFTPATKAESGHDENIDFERCADIVGRETAEALRDRSLALYRKAADYARERGIIICDTKFEWGDADGEMILVDEVLTPDSSRFWPADEYQPGRTQPSFDKQPVRDWLEATGWDKTPPAPALPPEVVEATSRRYLEAYERLTGRTLAI